MTKRTLHEARLKSYKSDKSSGILARTRSRKKMVQECRQTKCDDVPGI
jgi:hypothetical protein